MRVLLLSVVFSAFCIPSTAEAMSCPMNMPMNTAQEVSNWRTVNDGVMGGLSSGGASFKNGHMVFSGIINTNGGGFSSIRKAVIPKTFSNMKALKLKVKSDGRAYKVTFRTDARYGWREVSFQAPIPLKSAGQWEDVIIPFSDLRASVFGRPISGTQFNPARIQSIGIILSDGRDGPFQLNVESLEVCRG